MNIPLTILGSALTLMALVTFFFGIRLFYAGSLQDQDIARAQAAKDSPSKALADLMRRAFKVAFGGKDYPKSQRMMAQGLLLIESSILALLAAIASIAAAGAV